MANNCIISHLNPLHFTPMYPTVYPQYDSRDIDDYPFAERLEMWQEKTYYKQKWKIADAIPLQFESNFSPLQLDVFSLDLPDPVITLVMTQVAANPRLPGWYVYEAVLSLAGLPEGCYYVRLSPGNNPADQEASEPLQILQAMPEKTVLVQYKHSHFHEDVIFETGIQFNIRVEGAKGKLTPASMDTLYRDQQLNPFQLASKGAEFFDFSYGGSFGIPDWMVRKLGRIWTCDTVMHDGKSFMKNVGDNNTGTSGFQVNEQEDYPLYGLTMQIAPGVNRASKIIAPTVDTSKKIIIASVVDGTLFGDLSANVGENLVPINSITY